ncbi:MAG: hypothetical protein IJ081_04395 [Prevotella sp.]|nr:hypothetical protein [Prevotella sp.]
MKRYILAALALSVLGGSPVKTLADTSKLTAADGWTKITTVPTASDIANNYYVFVDNGNDLMLGVAKGVNQNTKWYSLGLYYQTSVEPTSADMNGKTWILESCNGGFAMRNLEYSVFCLQTEWGANWKWDTNDVQTPNEWSKINLAYLPEGCWTIENGHDAGNYIGPWTNGNFTNGAECAGNKTGSNVGKYQIYAISRTQFKQNLLDNASDSNPVDLTPWYVTNATFDAGNRTGWEGASSGSGGNNNTSTGGGCEIWNRSSFKIYQNLTVPNGKYKISLQMAGTAGTGEVYGTSGATTVSKASTESGGADFQATILAMMQDRTHGQTITDEITVSDGSLEIGMTGETGSSKWLVFDDFKLYCTGVDLSAYEAQLDELVSECNDFIASGVVPEACENAIASAISTYDQSYSTAKEYSTAIVALTNVLNTYKSNTDLKAAYASYKTFRTSVTGLTAGQPASEALTTFNSAVTTANNNVEAATTVAAINTQQTALRTAALTYISSVEGQFDITFLASQVYSDWKKNGGTSAGIVADQYLANRPGSIPSFAENFEWTAATTGNVLYQTVSEMPVGYYQVGMYAMALSTSERDTGISTEATEGDADRTFAFAGDLNDATTILRTGMPIKFATAVNFDDLTILDVNVHLSNAGDLTFGVQKDLNGSNWHFAQIASILYSSSPDLTGLQATRDALVAEAEGLLNSSAEYLTAAQQSTLQSAIDNGNNAADYDALNTVTLVTLPNAINNAKQQIQQVKDNRVLMIAALERFENDYNLADGTDYRRQTMSADAWSTLITKVNAVTTALDDVSLASEYATRKNNLIAQMDLTDTSLRLHKSYKAMSEGVSSIVGGSAADSDTDNDETEQAAITSLNTAFNTYVFSQTNEFSANAFLGSNLDFSAAEGATLNSDNSNNIHAVSGWDVDYADADTWAVLQTHQGENDGKLYIRKNWGSSATRLTATKERMLPAGRYRLSLLWNSPLENMTNLSCYKLGNVSTAVGKATEGAETLTYDFTVTVPTPFDLIIGFQKTGTGNTAAQIVVDNVSLTCMPPLVFADGSLPAYTPGTYPQVKISRTLTGGKWATAVYPFAVSKSADLKIATLDSYDKDNGALSFAAPNASTANEPFLMRSTAGATEICLSNVEVAAASATDATKDEASMKGSYSSMNITNAEKNYVLSNNAIYPVGTVGATINPYRAYIQIAQNAPARLNFFVDGEETTDISGEGRVDIIEFATAPVYNLNGQRVQNAKKGIFIQNGRKVVIK